MERRWSDRAFWVGPNEAAPVWPRVVLALLGLILMAQAVWILLPELQRPQRPRVAVDENAEAALGQARDARRAAKFAVVRGDLWVRSAFAHSDLLSAEQASGPDHGSAAVGDTRADLERAVRYSPHRGDAWLLLAAMADRYGWQGYQPAALLKMSYYTAPSDQTLFLSRIQVALHVVGLEDADLADMVGRDIRLLITRMPAAKPALLGVYKAASSPGRRVVERAVTEVDPAYLAVLRRDVQ